MFRKEFTRLLAAAYVVACLPLGFAQRGLEDLGRGVVAVRASDDTAFVSWRLLGLDPDSIGFNLYRAEGSGDFERLNSEVLTEGTNFEDSTVNLESDNTYYVTAVIDGEEQPESDSWTLEADSEVGPLYRVPLRPGGPMRYLWVGDLDGDGEYDFVLDRQEPVQRLEAYRRDGTFLWEVNYGHNSEDQGRIESGSSTINLGHNDGVTVYDFDSDGYAEVAIKISNNVTLGDGEVFEYQDDNHQFVAFLSGRTGSLLAYAPIPDDYISDGPMMVRYGVGYLDGERPHLAVYMKNRQDGGDFNLIEAAYTFDGDNAQMEWKWLRGDQDAPDGHQTRIIDVDGDGVDEICEIGYCLNGDGTLRYTLGPAGVVHGDRFHIAKMDPSRRGLQGYGVQQRNPSFLTEYYYDATNGRILWEHFADEIIDNGRGMAADIDPTQPGMEVWSFYGLYNAASNDLTNGNTSLYPYPQLSVWWDGDELRELINDGNVNKWDHTTDRNTRLVSPYRWGAQPVDRDPVFVGDLIGDWREEMVFPNADFDELLIFTTDHPSDLRLYTLMHNPGYRNAVTLKGYVQDSHPDYFLGAGMTKPRRPSLYYV